jgi:hypothetical protein
MDFVVTEAGIHVVVNGGIRRIDAAECAQTAVRIAADRRLPH